MKNQNHSSSQTEELSPVARIRQEIEVCNWIIGRKDLAPIEVLEGMMKKLYVKKAELKALEQTNPEWFI